MPWFKIDDSAHSHPKWVKAGNAALGLWLRCGAYSAQHLLEGRIPGDIAKLYGTAPQAAKLVKVGLWHDASHECPRCPQPGPGDFVVHDFFEGGRNSTRAQAEASRRAAADRQAKSRAAAAEAARHQKNASDSDSKASRFEGQSGSESQANASRNESQFQGSAAGQEYLSRRDADTGVTPIQASPLLSAVPPTEVQPASSHARETVPHGAEGPQIPAASASLVHALTSAGVVVGWGLNPGEWFMVEALIKRCGVPALVDQAVAVAEAARPRPRSARYLLAAWRDLPDHVPPQAGHPPLRAVPDSPTSAYLADMAAIADELAAQVTEGA